MIHPKRHRDEEGSMIIALMFVFLTLALTVAFASSSARAISTSATSKQLTATQQLRYTASQDAIAVLSAPRKPGEPIRERGNGTVDFSGVSGAAWSWTASPQSGLGRIEGCTGQDLYFPPTVDARRVVATGTARVRTTTSLSRCFLVYGVRGTPEVIRDGSGSEGSYTGTVNVSPNSVFGHTLFGTAGVRFAGSSITGSVGASDDVELNVGRTPEVTNGGVFLYPSGPGAPTSRCTNSTRTPSPSPCANTHTFDQRVQLDVVQLDDLAAATARPVPDPVTGVTPEPGVGCGDEATDPNAVDDSGERIDPGSTIKAFETSWIASEHGGVLDLSPGKQQCYKNLTFDVSTRVVGTSGEEVETGGVFASGNITFGRNANVNSAGNAKLAVYAVGNLDSRVEFAGGGTTTTNAFVYAPRSECATTGGDSNGRSFAGSISCRTVSIEDRNMSVSNGAVKPSDPFDYNTGYYPIWYPEQSSVSGS